MTWKPEGEVGQYFKVIAKYQPPPPEGVGNPFDWGRTDYATELLGESFELTFGGGNSVHTLASGEALWELFSTSYGPMKVLADSLDPTTRAAFRSDYIAFAEGYKSDDSLALPREYLLIIGHRK